MIGEEPDPEQRSADMETIGTMGIEELELFAECSKKELRQIDGMTTLVRLPKDRVLIREGERSREFIVIGSGRAQVTRRTPEGISVVSDIGGGDMLGEMELINGTNRAATVTAATDLTVFVSTVGEFRSILRIAPSVARKIRMTASTRSRDFDAAAA
jgi:CRP-like cAMP-binding protein